ncbi:hypothetical protein NONI108955_28060 [Nocardia ninae]
MHDGAGRLFKVRCPSILCSGMVPLVDGKISLHEGTVPGACPWIGMRVVDDTADLDPDYLTKLRSKRVL